MEFNSAFKGLITKYINWHQYCNFS